MKEIRHSNVKHVTKVLLNPKVQTHWEAICGLKLTPHFTLFDPANMIPTLGNKGLHTSQIFAQMRNLFLHGFNAKRVHI